MDFIQINSEIRIIPENIKDSVNGIIKKTEESCFFVLLEKSSVDLKEGIKVEFIITKENHLLRSEAEIKSKEGLMICLSTFSGLRVVQRREFPRVEMSIPVVLAEIDNPQSVINSITKNIGGGGMQLSLTEKLFDTGKILSASFNISQARSINASIEVLRTEKNSTEYYLSGKFKNISGIDKTAIIQLCFKRQLELKCKNIK